MTIIQTVNMQVDDMILRISQFSTFDELTPESPEVLSLISVLQNANTSKPLLKLEVAAELDSPDGLTVVGWHYWLGDRTGDGEVKRTGQITGNAPGRAQIENLIALGVTNILVLFGQPLV